MQQRLTQRVTIFTTTAFGAATPLANSLVHPKAPSKKQRGVFHLCVEICVDVDLESRRDNSDI
jgi:hypothetical protein